MHSAKIPILFVLSLTIGFLGCTAKEQKAAAPKEEQIIKNLTPAKAEIKGLLFLWS